MSPASERALLKLDEITSGGVGPSVSPAWFGERLYGGRPCQNGRTRYGRPGANALRRLESLGMACRDHYVRHRNCYTVTAAGHDAAERLREPSRPQS